MVYQPTSHSCFWVDTLVAALLRLAFVNGEEKDSTGLLGYVWLCLFYGTFGQLDH